MSEFRRRLMMQIMSNVDKKVYYIINSNIAHGNVYFDGVDTGFVTNANGETIVEILESQAKESYKCIIRNGEYLGYVPSANYIFSINPAYITFPESGGTNGISVNSTKMFYDNNRSSIDVYKNQSNTYKAELITGYMPILHYVYDVNGPFDVQLYGISTKTVGIYSGYAVYKQKESGKTIKVEIRQG